MAIKDLSIKDANKFSNQTAVKKIVIIKRKKTRIIVIISIFYLFLTI